MPSSKESEKNNRVDEGETVASSISKKGKGTGKPRGKYKKTLEKEAMKAAAASQDPVPANASPAKTKKVTLTSNNPIQILKTFQTQATENATVRLNKNGQPRKRRDVNYSWKQLFRLISLAKHNNRNWEVVWKKYNSEKKDDETGRTQAQLNRKYLDITSENGEVRISLLSSFLVLITSDMAKG